jgi:hypothetical protein
VSVVFTRVLLKQKFQLDHLINTPIYGEKFVWLYTLCQLMQMIASLVATTFVRTIIVQLFLMCDRLLCCWLPFEAPVADLNNNFSV